MGGLTETGNSFFFSGLLLPPAAARALAAPA
jgi:hypothetical protein